MTATSQDQTEKIPGTVFSPRQVKQLKFAVIAMGIALVGGFALVMGTIVYQASSLGKSTPAAVAKDASLALGSGETISHIALDGDRLAVHVTGPTGQEIRVIDMATGRVIARIGVKPE